MVGFASACGPERPSRSVTAENRASSRVAADHRDRLIRDTQESPVSDNTKLVAEKRTDFGKGAARKIRRAGNIPAVMYGHGTEPVHISLPGHDTMMALKQVIDHVDLVVVRKGEKVTVDVAVHLEGEAAPETVVTLDHNTLQVEALATNIPENVVVSVEGLEAGTQILAGAVELPEGSTLITDAEALVVNVTQAISAEALEAELAEAEAEAGIEREESDEEAAEAAEGETAEGAEAKAEGDEA